MVKFIKFHALIPALAAVLVGGAVAAQDGGANPAPGGGVVLKGRAPVAKDLLKVRFPKPKSFKLGNGLAVYVLEDHKLPAVRFTLTVRAGSFFDPKPGVADRTASMLMEGVQGRDAQQISSETESIGVNASASGGMERATISVSGLSESTDYLITLLTDLLLHPTFPQDRLDRSRQQGGGFGGAGGGPGRRGGNPAGITAVLSNKVFYGGTPYGRQAPTAAERAAVTRDDLVAFHAAYYRPNGAVLGVSGDIDTAALKAKLESLLANWKPGDKVLEIPKAEVKPKDATKIYLVDRPGSAQTVLQFGNVAVKRDDPDYIALVVANRILGGGSSARLFQNIRERQGYTYGAYSSLAAGQWPGIWGANASVRTPVTEPAVREFFNEFNRLQDEPVPAIELERAKRSIVGSFALTLESPQGILGRTLELVQDGLPLDYWDTYPRRIEAVTAADVQRVARQYLGKNRIQLFAVGERKEIEDGLKKFGPVEIVDASTLGGGATGGGRRSP